MGSSQAESHVVDISQFLLPHGLIDLYFVLTSKRELFVLFEEESMVVHVPNSASIPLTCRIGKEAFNGIDRLLSVGEMKCDKEKYIRILVLVSISQIHIEIVTSDSIGHLKIELNGIVPSPCSLRDLLVLFEDNFCVTRPE
ncbi:MAG: hypothetical protein ACI84C_000268 [Flavobacteriales bacterium]|jgi:hypothetical protein